MRLVLNTTASGWFGRLLQRLRRRELRRLADKYPMTREELVRYHDLVAIECINHKTKGQERMLGVAVATASMLEEEGG